MHRKRARRVEAVQRASTLIIKPTHCRILESHSAMPYSMEKRIHEKRVIKRHQLRYYLKVYNRKTGKPIGYIVNISTEGMRLVSHIPLLTHSVFQFRIKLPREIEGERNIDFDALSCWCRPDVSPDCFDTGFKLIDAPKSLLDLVESLTQYFTFGVLPPGQEE